MTATLEDEGTCSSLFTWLIHSVENSNPDFIASALFGSKDESQIEKLTLDDAKATLAEVMGHAALQESVFCPLWFVQ